MTDKQTNTRSSCWSITAWNDDLTMLQRVQDGEEKLPPFIKCLWGGREICPKTNRPHFQGCLETKECRFSQVKRYLPNSHIEKAFKREALQKYAMKSDTADGDKVVSENECFMSVPVIIEKLIRMYRIHNKDSPTGSKQEFQDLFDMFIYQNGVYYVGVLSDLRTYRTYKMSCKVLFKMLIEDKL